MDESDRGDGQVLPDLRNGISEAILHGAVRDIENLEATCAEIMEKARMACEPHLTRIKDIVKEAAECGVEKKAFKAKLRERALLRKAEGQRDTLSERQREVFDEISVKLEGFSNTPTSAAN